MGDVVPFRRIMRQGDLSSLRKHLSVGECQDKFLSAAVFLGFGNLASRSEWTRLLSWMRWGS